MQSLPITVKHMVAPVLAYVLLGIVGLSLAVPPGYVSPMFPAAGLALALVLVRGAGAVVLVWVGSFIANVGLAIHHGGMDLAGVAVAATVGIGASVQAVVGAAMVRRAIGDAWQRLEQDREILTLMALGGPVACVISASLGVTAMTLAGNLPAGDAGFAWWSWWTGDALGVLIAAPLSLLFLRADDYAVQRRTLLSLPIALTLALVFVAFTAVADWEESRLRAQIRDRAELIAGSLQGRFDALAQALSALRRLVEVTPGLTVEQFAHFAKRTLDDKVEVAALSVNPLVLASERAGFEVAQGDRLKLPGYRITERDSERRLVAAGDRDVYVPVALIEPARENFLALGFDINSNPARADAIARARLRGGPAATTVIQLVQEATREAGVLVLHPVMRIGEAPKPANVTGFVVAVIRVPELMANVMGPVFPGLNVRVADDAAEPARRIVFEHAGEGAPIANLAESALLSLADRTWSLTLMPTEAYLREHRTWAAWVVGVAGILFASVLQVLMLVSSGRSVAISRRVEEQTAELRIKGTALEELLDAHDALIRRIPVGVFKLRLRGDGGYGFDFASPNYCEQLGIDAEAVQHDPRVALDRIHPEDREEFRRSQAIARLSMKGHAWEGRILRAGIVRWIRLQSTPTRLENGDVVWEGVQEDVTERVVAEERQRLLATAVAQSSASIMITDRAGEIVFVNDAFVRVTGYSRDEVMGRNPRILRSGNTATSVYRELWTTIVGGGTWQGELQNKTKAGAIFWELATISPVTDGLGRISHFIAIKEDITEKRRQEAELRAAKEEAEAANLARSRFLDNVSHEVRTPMNGILGMAQLLRMPGTSEAECREYADAILASGNALRAMLDDILRLSEIESGKLELLPLRFDGAALLGDAAAAFLAPAEHKGLSLSARWEGEDVVYQGDAQRLRQMLAILIGNAVKYTRAGQIEVRGAEAGRDGSMATLRFAVTDTGVGLRAEHAARVFHSPFLMAGDKKAGSLGGLGLPLVHRLARLMQGQTGLNSEPGGGSCFWFQVRVMVVDGAASPGGAVEPTVAATAGTTAGARALAPGVARRGVLQVSIDVGDLRRRFGGDGELMQIAIDAFLNDLPTLTNGLAAAFSAGDQEQIKVLAVALGGAARAVSAAELAEIAQAISEAAIEGGAAMHNAHAGLADAVARVRETLAGLARSG